MAAWNRLFVSVLASVCAASALADDAPVRFARDVHPLLLKRCFKCHSSAAQEGGLRLDSAAAILKGSESGAVVVPGQPGESKLLAAIRHTGDVKMPPAGDPMPPVEIAVIERWIAQGATGPAADEVPGADHWAFQRPRLADVPAVANGDWNGSAIDRFLAAEQARAVVVPLPEAPRHVLLRRATLDLTGVPPTVEELAEFEVDASPDAYEQVVERLLASPRYGERWGRHWMDVWRYSDWDGYAAEVRESQPHIWRWRDWIVESLNAGKPYDRMIVEMLAADEVAPTDPNALRATGLLARNWYRFNRNVQIDWTVEHVGKAFQAVTWNCARCHDHMYDPMPQTEYYQLRAVFEPHELRTDRLPGKPDVNVDGLVRAFDAKAETPTFVFKRGNEKDPDKDRPISPGLPAFYGALGMKVEPISLPAPARYSGLLPYVRDEMLQAAEGEITAAKQAIAVAQKTLTGTRERLAALAGGPKPEPKKIEPALSDDFDERRDNVWKFPSVGDWRYADGKLLQREPVATFAGIETAAPMPRDFTAKVRWKTTGGAMWRSVGLSWDCDGEAHSNTAYASAYAGGPKVQLSYKRGGADNYPNEGAKPEPIKLDQEYELRVDVFGDLTNVSLDGRFLAAFKFPGDRKPENRIRLWTFDATAEFLSIEILPRVDAEGMTAPGGAPAPPADTEDSLKLAVADREADEAIAAKRLVAAEQALVSLQKRIEADDRAFAESIDVDAAKQAAIAAAAAERGHAVAKAEAELATASHKSVVAKRNAKEGDEPSKKAATDAEAAVQAATKVRDDAIAAAGQPGENYSKLTPIYPETTTGRRAALAAALASKDNPLTARVAVNHVWMRHFGQPLVVSVFDFGRNGKSPTHPELLDQLAIDFMASGWDFKSLHRAIVTSRAYRGGSSGGQTHAAIVEANSKVDPENRLLWRANPRRMEAEVVRDSVLAIAGSLDATFGGPDLDPVSGFTTTRRSLYFRTAKEKKMTFLEMFDRPNPVECYRRAESVAPQQALALANSELALVQSRALAGRLGKESATDDAFVALAFARILGRAPSADETAACREFLAEQSARLANPASLTKFAGAAAKTPPASDAAARARENLVQILFNHNDFVTIR